MLINSKSLQLLFSFSISIIGVSCSSQNDSVFISNAPSNSTSVSTLENAQTENLLHYLNKRPASPKQQTSSLSVNTSKITSKRNVTSGNLEDHYNISEVKQLFNGIDLTGWVNETNTTPQGWVVENGLLRLVDPINGKDLLTQESFTNYILTFEWRFGKKCNSGVKYKIEQPNQRGWIGLEYQVQDDANVEDGKIANRKIASLFDVFAAKESSKSSLYATPKSDKPTGEFRKGKIVVYENQIEHWIDDEKVLSFTIGSAEWNHAKAQSKFKNQKNFGLVAKSPILLQAHGYPIDFKTISIQTLESKDK